MAMLCALVIKDFMEPIAQFMTTVQKIHVNTGEFAHLTNTVMSVNVLMDTKEHTAKLLTFVYTHRAQISGIAQTLGPTMYAHVLRNILEETAI